MGSKQTWTQAGEHHSEGNQDLTGELLIRVRMYKGEEVPS